MRWLAVVSGLRWCGRQFTEPVKSFVDGAHNFVFYLNVKESRGRWNTETETDLR